MKHKLEIHLDEEGWYGFVDNLPVGQGGKLLPMGFRASRFRGERGKKTLEISAKLAIEKMKKQPKTYRAHGFAGCVQKTKNRKTGHMVGVYNAEQAGFDQDGGPWAVICEKHDFLVNFTTLKMARSWASSPDVFCDVCREEHPDDLQ